MRPALVWLKDLFYRTRATWPDGTQTYIHSEIHGGYLVDKVIAINAL
jgi:hypothetical protein